MADGKTRRLCLAHSPFNGAYFCGGRGQEGDGSFQVVWNERRVIAWSYWLWVPTLYPLLNTAFDDVISLRGSCRNNALPRSPWKKLQLAACEKSFLTKERNTLLRRHAIHIVFGGGAESSEEPGENNANRLLFQKLYIYIVYLSVSHSTSQV